MHKKLSLIAIILASLLFVLYSCTKQENSEGSDPRKELTQAAKRFYESSSHASLNIAWDHPIFSSDLKRVSFPLIWTATFEIPQKAYRRLVISQDGKKKLSGEIMEAVPTTNYFNTHPKGINNTDFEGTLGAYDFEMKFKYADYYEKGALKYKGEIKTFPSKKAYTQAPKPEACYSVQATYYQNGVYGVVSYYYCDQTVGGPLGGGESGQGSGEGGGPSIDRYDKADPEWDGGSSEPVYYVDKDPCVEKKNINNNSLNPIVKAQNDKIKAYLSTSQYEWGTEHVLIDYQRPEAGYKDKPIRTDNQIDGLSSKFTWNASEGYTIGFVHDHPADKAPSPNDIFDMVEYGMSNPDLERSWGGKAFFLNNASVTVIASDLTYVVTINDWDALQALYNTFHSNEAAFNQSFEKKADAYNSGMKALIRTFGNSINLYVTETPKPPDFVPVSLTTDNRFSSPCP